jgi:myosin protein heavy chain
MEILENGLQKAERARRSAEEQLMSAQRRETEIGATIEKLLGETQKMGNELELAGTQIRDLEDSVVDADRRRASLEREVSALNERLDAEQRKSAKVDSARRAMENEALQFRQVLGEHLDHIRELKKELRERTNELEKARLLQDTKIVEHVHVLEEAKRYTDRQLEETRGTVAARDQYIRNLEKTKARLVSELEDLKHQRQQEQVSQAIGDRDRNELRVLEQKVAAARAAAERERQAKELAEAEVKKLESELSSRKYVKDGRPSPVTPGEYAGISPGTVYRRSASIFN